MKRLQSYVSLFLIVVGFLFLFQGTLLLYQRHNPARVAFAREPETHQVFSNQEKKVVSLEIPRVGIFANVEEGSISDGKWKLSTESVMHLTSSVTPGEVGNSIIYGHNWQSLFGKLDKVAVNDDIFVTLSSGEKIGFQVEYIYEVSPKQVDILKDVDHPRITIYTCSGFLDSKRLVVVGKIK